MDLWKLYKQRLHARSNILATKLFTTEADRRRLKHKASKIFGTVSYPQTQTQIKP